MYKWDHTVQTWVVQGQLHVVLFYISTIVWHELLTQIDALPFIIITYLQITYKSSCFEGASYLLTYHKSEI